MSTTSRLPITAELLDDGRTVLIDGVRIAVDLIADALITDKPRRQIIRYDNGDGSYILAAVESYRKDDLIHFRSTCHLVETDGDKILSFLGLKDTSREEIIR